MTRSLRLVCVTALLALAPLSSSFAQTPDKGFIGAGGDIGLLFPDNSFENTLTLDGFGEYYVTPRISVRAMLSWASPGFDNRTEDHLRQTRLLFNGVYNWEKGTWHPFATAGVGAYFVRQILDGRTDPDGESRGGINLGGGVEYFTNRTTAVKVEGRIDVISHPPGLPDATGLTLTVGLKKYF